jgi:SAM-dependent methyltransferase
VPAAPIEFLERQRRFFTPADPAHFAWQTRHPYFAGTERALLDGVPLDAEAAVLEVGCGEGGNLVNVVATARVVPRLLVGADLFEDKVRFARRHVPPARFVCGDALTLPFRDGSFDVILCRDLLHHLAAPERAVAELRRVCRVGGNVWVVEPNGRNPLVQLLALLRPHERGQLRNSARRLRALLAPHFRQIDLEVRQPLPLYRMLLHYQYGLPALGRSRMITTMLSAVDRVLHAVWPRGAWAYIIVKLVP